MKPLGILDTNIEKRIVVEQEPDIEDEIPLIYIKNGERITVKAKEVEAVITDVLNRK